MFRVVTDAVILPMNLANQMLGILSNSVISRVSWVNRAQSLSTSAIIITVFIIDFCTVTLSW